MISDSVSDRNQSIRMSQNTQMRNSKQESVKNDGKEVWELKANLSLTGERSRLVNHASPHQVPTLGDSELRGNKEYQQSLQGSNVKEQTKMLESRYKDYQEEEGEEEEQENVFKRSRVEDKKEPREDLGWSKKSDEPSARQLGVQARDKSTILDDGKEEAGVQSRKAIAFDLFEGEANNEKRQQFLQKLERNRSSQAHQTADKEKKVNNYLVNGRSSRDKSRLEADLGKQARKEKSPEPVKERVKPAAGKKEYVEKPSL